MTAHLEVMDLVAQMKAAEQAFVLATVVRTVSVTAAKAGAKAIIRPDGTIVAGWIGGGCAKGAVLKAAREALADGEPRMVSVQPENLLAELGVKPGENRDGVRFASNMCPSKGTMDIFVEPVLPHPSLVILGASPVALSLATQARQLGYHVTLAAPAADLAAAPDAHVIIDGLEPRYLNDARRFVVGSTQGKGDEAALNAPSSPPKASRPVRSIMLRRPPASISAPSRRRRSRCRSWRRSPSNGGGANASPRPKVGWAKRSVPTTPVTQHEWWARRKCAFAYLPPSTTNDQESSTCR